jgi:hypothetical protein
MHRACGGAAGAGWWRRNDVYGHGVAADFARTSVSLVRKAVMMGWHRSDAHTRIPESNHASA